MSAPSSTKTLKITGTHLFLDDAPFFLQGLSFFNAIYNPTFNHSEADRLQWLTKINSYGINTLRIWCQWDFRPPQAFIDVAAGNTLFTDAGEIIETHLRTLIDIIRAADGLGMVLEICLFAHERQPLFLPVAASEKAVAAITQVLKPYRNIILQIWNESSLELPRYVKIAKSVDPERIVTSSPGHQNNLGVNFDHVGEDEHCQLLDLLTPHTVRGDVQLFWRCAPAQIEYLLETYQKPVIDDEPARSGPTQFGGIQGGTRPEWHIEQCQRVRKLGGYHIYHHDMFQYGYNSSLTPPSGIPDPEFSAFHHKVFCYLRDHRSW
jgi:hypothetical protein